MHIRPSLIMHISEDGYILVQNSTRTVTVYRKIRYTDSRNTHFWTLETIFLGRGVGTKKHPLIQRFGMKWPDAGGSGPIQALRVKSFISSHIQLP